MASAGNEAIKAIVIFGGQQRQYTRDAHAHARTSAISWSYRCRQGVWVG